MPNGDLSTKPQVLVYVKEITIYHIIIQEPAQIAIKDFETQDQRDLERRSVIE